MKEEASLTRRDLLGLAAAAGTVMMAGSVSGVVAEKALAEEPTAGSAGISGVRYGFLVEPKYCVGCEKCIKACREKNGLTEDTPDRRWLVRAEDSKGRKRKISIGCMHCENPSCMTVCPTGAISKTEAGAVVVDKDRCIGCKYCHEACPYGIPSYNSLGMDKCDRCTSAGIQPGEIPFCAQACKYRALVFGPLDELKKRAGEGFTPIEGSTGPSYILA